MCPEALDCEIHRRTRTPALDCRRIWSAACTGDAARGAHPVLWSRARGLMRVVAPKARQSVTAYEEVASAWAAAAAFSVSDLPLRNGVFAYDASSRARFAARV
jgi:hypothetical protein